MTPGPRPDGAAETPAVTEAALRSAAEGPLARRFSPRYLLEFSVLPLVGDTDGPVPVAHGAALDPTVVDEIAWVLERPVTLVAAPPDAIESAVLVAQAAAPVTDAARDLKDLDVQIVDQADEALDDVRALASQAPVIKLVNLAILEAVKQRASDVHFEAAADGLYVRHRIDGVLRHVATHPKSAQAAVLSRIKVMADLNIAERQVPQDGRVRLRLSNRDLDLRVSTLPTVHGESIVLRILDRGAGVRSLAELGMDPAVSAAFDALVAHPHGIVLATGPTGSGKTTTLYAALSQVNTQAVKIVTVEDPVEYQLDGVTQIPVNRKAGRTFATAMRSILRHDPDIIMVGEMRDRETAEIAIEAALTGHRVFSTLHTNDAPSGITRLLDMGVEPYLVSATVEGILAQRLVRTVCDRCGESVRPTAAERSDATEAGFPARQQRFRRGRGCDACAGTGYRGRTAVTELMAMNDGLRALIVDGASLGLLRARAIEEGMVPLYQAAWAKACEGITTPEEVFRVARDDGP